MPSRKPPVTSPVSYTLALSHASADKRIEVLRAVGASGSISQAARDCGVSYKAAWQAIDTLTNLAGAVLVERVVGGAGGGGARLTPAGSQLLDAAAQLAQARHQVLGRLAAVPARMPALIRTSMRNQLPGEVVSLQAQGTIVRVHLRLPGGATLVARITRDSAQLLGLAGGQGVIVLCKATAVTVAPADGAAVPGANLLAGRVARVSRGEQGDEISAALDGGLALVGFAPPRSALRARSRVVLRVDESALVLALAD
ncbi:MAG: TOBE domain-containing protein [Ramlibacter sp.]